MTKKAEAKSTKKKAAKIAEAKAKPEKETTNVEKECNDPDCHIHGSLKVRGRVFEGRVTRKFHKRITIELERMIYVRKYERYAKSKTKIHARLPGCMEKQISVGDLIQVQECRPLSKIIHFAVVKKIKGRDEK